MLLIDFILPKEPQENPYKPLSESTFAALKQYRSELKDKLRLVNELSEGKPWTRQRLSRLEIMSRGFRAILDELEQSLIITLYLAKRIQSKTEESMAAEELNDFHRFVYFQKNTYIRIFSAIDKLGYFLNEWLQLRVEREKPRFSYYTLLRVIERRKAHPLLLSELQKLRTRYDQPMRVLRQKRNAEIHLIDPWLMEELIDRQSKSFDEHHPIPDMKEEINLLTVGFTMVTESIKAVFLAAKSDF